MHQYDELRERAVGITRLAVFVCIDIVHLCIMRQKLGMRYLFPLDSSVIYDYQLELTELIFHTL